MRSIQLLRSLLFGVLLSGVAICTDRASAATEVLIEIDNVWSYEASNTDLGAGWEAVAYNDAGWLTGSAAIGYPNGENLPLTSVQTDIVRTSPVTPTIYFRTHFNFSGDPAGVTLISSNVVDDGAVFYLNGVEVGRVAMPTGDITFTTLSTRANDIGGTRIDVLEFPADSLVSGDNVLAVRLHQGSTTSSDAIFAMVLAAEAPNPGPPVFLSDPLDQEVGQGDPVTFRVTMDGTPPFTFQWKKDGVDIVGANSSFYTIPNAANSDEGVYSVLVSNPLSPGGVISEGALLTVLEGPVTLVSFGSTWSYEDTDTDLGTGWREIGFNDSSWASGPSPLGFPENEALPEYPAGSGTPLAVETTLLRTVGNLAYYFRKGFNFEGEPLDFELEITTLFDDGAVIYLNNQELLRVGVDEGPVRANTQAGRSIGNAGLETFTVPGDLLLNGANELAVESHQINGTSSDIIMGLRIVAQPLPPTTIGILEQPQSLTVEELKTATFSVGITGNTPRFQWFRIEGGGEPVLIPGANRPSYTIPNAMIADDMARFFVVISNVINRVVSETVDLTVIPDVNPPRILLADGTVDSTTVIVTFSEPLDENNATTLGNYDIEDTDPGSNLTISDAVLTNGTNVVLTTSARNSTRNYILTVNNVTDIAPAANVIAADSMRPITVLLELLRFDAQWDWFDPQPQFDEAPLIGSEWYTDPTYDIADQTLPGAYYPWFWRMGNGPFKNDLSDAEYPVRFNTALPQTPFVTTFFRTTFTYEGSPSGAILKLRHLLDDGALIYLNGVEVVRFNLPEGVIANTTPTTAAIGTASFETIEIPASFMNRGENLLAVQLHQRNTRDLDKFMGIELIATVNSFVVGPVVITSAPEDQTVVEGDPVTFSFVGVAGTTFQWRLNGVNIPGATDGTYTIPATSLSDSGKRYSVAVSNAENPSPEISGEGTLTVLPDVVPPRPLSAKGDGNQVTIQFNEAISAATGNQTANYAVTTAEDGVIGVVSASTDGSSVTLTLASAVSVGAKVLISNIRDASTAGNVMPSPCLFSIGFGGLILPFDAVWKYEDSDADLGTAWREPAFNDSAWLEGPGLFGEEGASLPELIRTTIAAPQVNPNPPSAGPNTSYYRTTFDLPVAPESAELLISLIIDDGVVVYLNGEEIYRLRVAVGQNHDTFAGSVGDAALEGPFELMLPTGLLKATGNVLAAEIHQTSAGSSDTVFGLELALQTVPSVKIIVPPPPRLFIDISPVPGRVRVSWEIPEGNFILEQAVRPEVGPWIPLPPSITAPPNTFVDRPRFGVQRYFRLKEQQ